MSISLIDNSLCDCRFSDGADEKDILDYIKALRDYGISYNEIVPETLELLPEDFDFEGVILRASDAKHIAAAESRRFGYVCLTEETVECIPYIKSPVMLELEPAGSNFLMHILNVFSAGRVKNISLLRIKDDFDIDARMLAAMVSLYKRESMYPLDICPTDGKLTAVSSLIAAAASGADCVTMRFGSIGSFAELQDSATAMAGLFSVPLPAEVSDTLKRCERLYRKIYGREADSAVKRLANEENYLRYCGSGDEPDLSSERVLPVVPIRREQNDSILYRRLKSLNVESENAADLEKAIEDFCMKLYKS